MGIVVWVLQGLLALVYFAAGVAKLVRPKPALVSAGMGWADDYSDAGVKGIGVVEVIGAIGLILPWVTGILPVLTPLAAVGLLVVSVLAVATHVRRKETIVPPLVLGILALAVAVLRFGSYAYVV
ncbi:DoxX family protein [Pseudonocardia sp. TRM90224]|uniref:DoxX family protein n=1 Tax=Pseudonocardia sp. TRM90224 TaxID=2812678 RepID=UPI001E526D49|nr:DoxX family protein [Pseudonocardia sp. TRM90224]